LKEALARDANVRDHRGAPLSRRFRPLGQARRGVTTGGAAIAGPIRRLWCHPQRAALGFAEAAAAASEVGEPSADARSKARPAAE